MDTRPREKGQMRLERLLDLHRDFMALLYCCLWFNSDRDFSQQAMSQPARLNLCDLCSLHVARGMFQFFDDLRVYAVHGPHQDLLADCQTIPRIAIVISTSPGAIPGASVTTTIWLLVRSGKASTGIVNIAYRPSPTRRALSTTLRHHEVPQVQ